MFVHEGVATGRGVFSLYSLVALRRTPRLFFSRAMNATAATHRTKKIDFYFRGVSVCFIRWYNAMFGFRLNTLGLS